MPRGLVVAAFVVGLVIPAQASAADLFVGASRPGASDGGPCTSAAAPCATIQAAVDKSEAHGGGNVRVLANPDGKTTDTYQQAVVLDGSQPVTLIGAGRRANGTRVAPSSGTPLNLAGGTTARSLRIVGPTGGRAVVAAATSTLDDAFAEVRGGTAYEGSGRVEDSRFVGATGALLDAGRLVRTDVTATVDGVVVRLGTSQLLQVAVRARTTSGNPPTGEALRVGGGAGAARGELRHVTLTGFPTRVRLDGRPARAGLQAANSTFAGVGGTDLLVQSRGASAKLRTVNRSPSRTSFTNGAGVGSVMDTDPVDLAPDLTPEGNLAPSSPLIDRGTREGILNGSSDNAKDIGGAPRRQGAEPDIGADETPPADPDGLRWVSVGTTFLEPMYVASPPGDPDKLFVVERRGTVIVVDDGVVIPGRALDIISKVTGKAGGGFQSIAFPPDFAADPRVYGFYPRKDDPATPEVESPGDIVIAEWKMDPANPNRIDAASRRHVIVIEHPLKSHYGGTIAFGPDGYLYISTGDGDTQPIPSQDISQPLGKILRIDPDDAGAQPYTVPPDNPYVGVPGAMPEVWARGFRNPFRMGFDSLTGDLFVGDVGNNLFEELNILHGAEGREPGSNFGWRSTEGDFLFNSGGTTPVTPANAPPDYVAPAVVQRHDEGDRSITAGTVVRDPTIPSLQGKVLYADFFRGVTRAAVAAPGGVSADGEVEGLPAVPGVTSYSTDSCGRIYATSLFSGEVLRLTTTGECVD